MNARGAAGMGVIAGAAGACLGVALLASQVAYADDWPLPVPPYSAGFPSIDLQPVGFALGTPTNVVYNESPGSSGFQQDNSYTSVDGYPQGSYDTSYSQETYGYQTSPFYYDSTETVTSSTGYAPMVGTAWQDTAAGIQFPTNVIGEVQIDFYSDYNVTNSTGRAEDFVLGQGGPFSIQNESYSGPAGTFDYLIFGTGSPIPIIDAPSESTSAAATDLAGATDAATLWSGLVGSL